MSCIGLAQFLGFFFLRRSDRWHFNKFYLHGAQLLAAAGLVLVFSFGQPLLFTFAFLMIGLCASLTYYSSLYYSVRLMKKKEGDRPARIYRGSGWYWVRFLEGSWPIPPAFVRRIYFAWRSWPE